MKVLPFGLIGVDMVAEQWLTDSTIHHAPNKYVQKYQSSHEQSFQDLIALSTLCDAAEEAAETQPERIRHRSLPVALTASSAGAGSEVPVENSPLCLENSP